MKIPRSIEELTSALEAGYTVPLIWKKQLTVEAVAEAGFEIVYLTDHIPVPQWNASREPYGAHLDRFRKMLIAQPVLMDRLYALKGKLLRGPLDAVVSAAYWLNNYTPEELATLADDFEVKHKAASGKAAAMLRKHNEYMKFRKALKAEIAAKADAERDRAERATALGVTLEELEVIEAAEAAAAAAAAEAAAEAAKLAKKKKGPKAPAPAKPAGQTPNPKPPAPTIAAPRSPAPPPRGEVKIPPLRMGLSRRSKPPAEGDSK